MKRRRLPPKNQLPTRRALLAFVATVVLAVMATAAVLLPDLTADSADSLARVPSDLGQWIPAGLFD